MAVSTRGTMPPLPQDPAGTEHDPGADAGAAPLWRLHSDAVNRRLLDRWLPPRVGSVLKTDLYDEAVSLGLYPELGARASRVVGIDVSPRVVAAATKRHDALEGQVADVRELPFDPGSFDAVVSNSTLDHLGDRAEVASALSEIARVTPSGGLLIITIDNPLNPLIALRNRLPSGAGRRIRQGFPYEPGWTCGPRALRAMLVASGFEVRSQTAILHAPRAGVARMRTDSGDDPARRIRRLLALERLEAAPTRYLTGHFVAALAVKRAGADFPAGS